MRPIVAFGVLIGSTTLAADEKPVSPTKVIRLFNGRDLSGLQTWLKEFRFDDPRRVFRANDGVLHITGDGLGYVRTKKSYRDYHLIVEFRWGIRTWRNRKLRTRDSGVLVHCTGPDGGYGGTFMTSIEAQIIEGGCGDFIVVAGHDKEGKPVPVSLDCDVTRDRDGESVWSRGGMRKTFTSGRINWFGRDPDWRDELGFRGRRDVESPGQEWTRMDVICDGDKISILVNGILVNEGFKSNPSSGPILIQAELAELFVRRWELWPIGQAPGFAQ